MTKREKLCQILKKYNVQQKDIAEKMGVTQGYINRYFTGKNKITRKFAYRFCDALIGIANERVVEGAELSISAKKLFMYMSNGNSIGDM